MAIVTEAQDHQVEAATRFQGAKVVGTAFDVEVVDIATRDEGLLARDVDLAEEPGVHDEASAATVVGRQLRHTRRY